MLNFSQKSTDDLVEICNTLAILKDNLLEGLDIIDRLHNDHGKNIETLTMRMSLVTELSKTSKLEGYCLQEIKLAHTMSNSEYELLSAG
jgi:hypothetical protein